MIAVVIPSKTTSNLIPCVAAIRKNEPDLQIIVVDDGLDQSLLPLGEIELIAGIRPFIFARNCNLGIRAAGNVDGVVLLNDDALLETPVGFSLLAEACRADASIGIIGATCNNVGNRAQWSQGIGLRIEPRMVCFVAAYIPTSTLETVGLLDERFVGYGFEDDDYCLRVRQAGLKIGIHDGCYVDHGSLVSTFRGNPEAPANLQIGSAIFHRKWGAGNWAL